LQQFTSTIGFVSAVAAATPASASCQAEPCLNKPWEKEEYHDVIQVHHDIVGVDVPGVGRVGHKRCGAVDVVVAAL
jgi:hypothetical protein